MSKKVAADRAGLLLAAGSVAAISAPHFRGGGHMRGGFDGPMFGERGDLFGGSPVRFGERLKEMDANKDGVITLEEFLARRDPTLRPLRQEQRRRRRSRRVRGRRQGERRLLGQALHQALRCRPRRHGSARRSSPRRAGSASPCATSTATAASASTTCARACASACAAGASDRGKDGQDEQGRQGGRQGCQRARAPRSASSACSAAPIGSFGRLDKNGDGFIDAKDLEPLAAERVAFASKRFFRRFDADGDGKVTQGRVQPLRQGALRQPRRRRRRQDHGCRPAADDARPRPFEVGSRTLAEEHHSRGIGVLAQKSGSGPLPRSGPDESAGRDGLARARGGGRGGGLPRPRRPASADRAGRGPAHAQRRCGGRGRGAGDAVAALAQCGRLELGPRRCAAMAEACGVESVYRSRARPPQHDGRGGRCRRRASRRASCASWPSASSARASMPR